MNNYGYNIVCDQLLKRAEVSKDNKKRQEEEAASIHQQLPGWLQKAVELSKTKGASTWLTVLPLTEHGFTLHKSAFQDALALRYGWTPTRLPSKCDCGNVEHALSCAKGGFPTLRHYEIRDTTASKFTTCERWPTQRRLSEQPRGCKTGHIGQWCLGGADFKKLTWYKSIQPARPLQQKPATSMSCNIQKTWTGKETGIPAKNPGSRTLLFHTFSAISYRRHGCRSNTLLHANASAHYSPRNGTSPTIKHRAG